MVQMDNYAVELGDRVIAAMYEENHGMSHIRRHVVAERALDAIYAAAAKPLILCDFSNKYGLCKFEKGHEGSHTVINLGNDD
jgi:hypothetical protein